MVMQSGSEIFRLESIVVRYGNFTALDIDRLAFERGRVYAVVGANGSGKTTLISLLGFLRTPSAGCLRAWGSDASAKGFDDAAARRRATVVMQEPYLFDGTVGENVAYGLRGRGLSSEAIAGRIESALSAVGMTGKWDAHSGTLSGGERRRVAIARALALAPEVLLLDECTANIDREAQSAIESLILRMRRERTTTVILSTHDRSFAVKTADEIVGLERGRLVPPHVENIFRGTVEQVDGVAVFRADAGNLTIEVISDKRGACVAAVPPADVLVSKSPISSSARNSYRGAIRRLEEIDAQVRVYVDVGIEVAAVITRKSYDEMGLHLGDEVFVTFKVSVVTVM